MYVASFLVFSSSVTNVYDEEDVQRFPTTVQRSFRACRTY